MKRINVWMPSFGTRRDPRKARPLSWSVPVEALEARKLMAAYTDVSEIAATVARHQGPTNLYINFDGGTVPIDPVKNPKGATNAIRSFETEVNDGSLDRQRDIQDILFEVSEVFAPFDVQVHRISGAGNYAQGPGDTTVFVGGNAANATYSTPGATFSYTKYTSGVTPAASSDYPRPGHVINSDPYDVAFVDPVVGSAASFATILAAPKTERGADDAHANIYDIKRAIAHEAAHTFGLSHVRSDGLVDPTPLGTGKINDVLAYDTNGLNDFFSEQALPLTSANTNGTTVKFNGSVPSFNDPAGHKVNFQTQNAYLTLADVLGARPTDQYANVADASTVDPIYTFLGGFQFGPGAAPKVGLGGKAIQYGALGRLGDDQVFTITPKSFGNAPVHLSLHATGGGLKPELLVYDATGKTLKGYALPNADGVAVFDLAADGSKDQVVVASRDGNSTGSYYLTIGSAFNNPVLGTPFTAKTGISVTGQPLPPTTPLDTGTITLGLSDPGLFPAAPTPTSHNKSTQGPPIVVRPTI